MIEVSLAPEIIVRPFGVPITNSLLAAWGAVSFLTVSSVMLSRNFRLIPGKAQAFVEIVLEGLLRLMDSVTQDRKKSERFASLVLTIFFFVITANWMGILPGVGSFVVKSGEHHVPLLRSAFSDLNNTLVLACIAVIVAQLWGLQTLGLRHVKKYFTLKNPIDFFVGILEAVSEVAKILSFSFRLFGNIFAGEILLLVIGSLVPVIAPVPFLGLELFVGFIQALVFATLALVFATMATVAHQDGH